MSAKRKHKIGLDSQGGHMRKLSIRKQLIIKYVSIILIFAAVSLGGGIKLAEKALIRNSGLLLSNFALEVGNNISKIIDLEIKNIEMVAEAPILRDSQMPQEEKLNYLRDVVEKQGYKKAALIDLQGNCVTINGEIVDVSDREYFKAGLNGESFLTAPFVSKADGGLQISITVPIKQDEKVTQILFFSKDAEEFSNITNSIGFGNTGTAYVVDKDGTNIINRDIQKVIDKVNRIEDAKTDPKYTELAAITEKMIAGENGTGQYLFNGAQKFLGYAPIKTTGWAVGITTELEDMLSGLSEFKTGMMASMGLMILGMIGLSYVVATRLSRRLTVVQEEVNQMASGDFTINEKTHSVIDEIANIDLALQETKASVGKMIADLQNSYDETMGQYDTLSQATNHIGSGIGNINVSIESSTQSCEEQANELSNISNILSELDDNLNENSDKMLQINSKSLEVSKQAEISCNDMNSLSESINSLNKSFESFAGEIDEMKLSMKTIDEMTVLINSIAEQTNLLALNAAIEAARAGEAGKGFSVVADEIRKLAEQSRNSSEKINTVINELLNKTESMVSTSMTLKDELEAGSENIHTTIDSFTNIVTAVEEISPMIDEASKNLNAILVQKNTIVTQVATASASSEELTAASQEILAATINLMNSSKEILEIKDKVHGFMERDKERVNKFKI